MKRCILAATCVIVASLLVFGQSSKGSLATLIQKRDRKAALEKIRTGADVNEAEADGQATAASAAEIRAMLQNAASKE